jgi:PE family
MSFAITAPDLMVAAATDFAGIGWAISAVNAAAAPTTGFGSRPLMRCRRHWQKFAAWRRAVRLLPIKGCDTRRE